MSNWNGTFSLPYASDLERGEIGNASDHARTITKYYVNTIKTGLIPGVPPTLPSPITLGAIVPIGPAIPINNYRSRQDLFYNTIKIYFEGKEILQGKANIQDLIQSSNRLIRQAKKLNGEIRSLLTQVELIKKEIAELPKTLLEIGKEFIQLIKDKLKELQDIRNLFIQEAKNYTTADFNPFADEIALLDKLANFKPTLNLADYRDLFILFSDLGKRVDSLANSFSSESNFKSYLLKKGISALKIVLNAINGFMDPGSFIAFLNDLARRERRYERFARSLSKFIQQSAKLTELKSEVDRKLKQKRQQLEEYIEPKIKQITSLIQQRISENANKIKKYKQSKIYVNAVKKAKEFKQTLDKKVKKRQKQIKKLRSILQQADLVVAKVDALSAGLKLEFDSIKNQVAQLNQKLVDIKGNITGEYDALSVIDFSTIKTPKDFSNIVEQAMGEVSALGAILLTTLQQYKITSTDLKGIFNKVDKKYDKYVDELDKLFDIEIPYLFLLVENINTDEVVKKPTKGSDVKVKKSSLASILKFINKVKLLIQKLKNKIESEIKKLTEFIKREVDAVKVQVDNYIDELSKSDSAIVSKTAKIIKNTNKALQNKGEALKQKKVIERTKAASDIFSGGISVLGNVASGKYLIRDNQDSLNKVLRGYYNYQKASNKMDPETASKERKVKSDELKIYAQYEVLVLLLVDLFKEIKNGDFKKEFEQSYANLKDGLSTNVQYNIEALKSLFDNPPTITNLSSVEQLNLAVLSDINLVNTLYRLEQKYLRKTKQTLKLAKDGLSKRKGKLVDFVVQFYNKVDKCPSLILLLLDYVKKILKELKNYIAGLVKPITDYVDKELDSIKQKIRTEADKLIEKNKEKLINVDAKAMSLVFNIATRLFWTGATWSNTAGTSFVTINIGPFKPLKALPQDGSKGIANEMAKSFENQLKAMSGQVIPNPATGIPPFPFSGYN